MKRRWGEKKEISNDGAAQSQIRARNLIRLQRDQYIQKKKRKAIE